MAEYIARAYGDSSSVDVETRSAGTLGLTNRPADPSMITVGAEIGLDLAPHVCQPITDELVDWADRIYVMEFKHHAHLEEFHPGSKGKIEMLGRFDDVDEIDDPIGAWFTWSFRRCRKQIERCVKSSMDRLPSEFHED
jgi:protein-tyrosine-phosphatase